MVYIALLFFTEESQGVAITRESVSKFYASKGFPEDVDYHRILDMSMSMRIPSTIVVPTIAPTSLSASNDSPTYISSSSTQNQQTYGPSTTTTSQSFNPMPLVPDSSSAVPNQIPLIANSPFDNPDPATLVPYSSSVGGPTLTSSPPTSKLNSLDSTSTPAPSSLDSPMSVLPTPTTIANSSITMTPATESTITPTASGDVPISGQSFPTTIRNPSSLPPTFGPREVLLPPGPGLPDAVKKPSIIRGGGDDNVTPVVVPNSKFTGLGAGAIVAITLAVSLALMSVAYLYWKQRRGAVAVMQ
eukprot:CAMPEP_0194206894 /NCGR_PEP_ID=MMETSP0156-20130528/5799_1 /TAXON_ID=33649 /ORGANISM="Thalassionema nitzschioides, Strain L26-B" /LENGTH=300 /DNA_ID=CAMNT_0038933531 /DNA_START=320 /DNA_END=1222 /DNA_ORIENTATION=+